MNKYDVIIIGGGPAGYAGAVSACERGMKVALIEKEYLGGVCVNWGCIPTKALLKFAKLRHEGQAVTYEYAIRQSMEISHQRRDSIIALIGRLGGKFYNNTAVKIEQGKIALDSGEIIEAENILIATGSTARKLPFAEYDDIHVITTREAFQLEQVPKSAVVIGSGATGIEFATIWSRFGAQVTVLEMLPRIMGLDDEEMSLRARAGFEKEGIEIRTQVKVTKVSRKEDGAQVTYEDADGEHVIDAQTVLVAAGIVPSSSGLGLEELGINMERGNIQIDDRMRTNIAGIYAAGDVTGKLALAFASTLQAKTAVKDMNGEETEPIFYGNIPRCIFSAVEGAFAGLGEQQAAQAGKKVLVKKVPLVCFDGSMITSDQGMAKIIADAQNGQAVGISMIGSKAAEMIAGPARLIEQNKPVEEVITAVTSGR